MQAQDPAGKEPSLKMRDSPTIGVLLEVAVGRLAAAGIEQPRTEAEILLGDAAGWERWRLRLHFRETVEERVHRRFEALLGKRAARIPLQHLLGGWPFLELDLICDDRALIPRPETEDLALAGRELLREIPEPRVADVGTGSGCLILALMTPFPGAWGVGIDIDPRSLALARENAGKTGLEGRVQWLRGDLLDPVREEESFDLIVANLPYVTEQEWRTLEPEVRDHDPRRALVAPEGGLALIHALAGQAPARLRAGGWLLLEMAPDQTVAVAERLRRGNWREVKVLEDRFSRPRMVRARWDAAAAAET